MDVCDGCVLQKEVALDRATLERYIELEKRIHEEESKNGLKALALKEEQLTDVEANIKVKQAAYDIAVKNW